MFKFNRFMSDLIKNIYETDLYLRQIYKDVFPEIAVVLGSGLGALADELDDRIIIETSQIPHWPVSTVEGHKGIIVFGKIADIPVIIQEGRIHYYEGYSIQEVVYPVQVLSQIGIKTLVLTNASGGINPTFVPGDMMIITDHINLMGVNPLIGLNNPISGLRFPDMSAPYDPEYIRLAEETARKFSIILKKGILVATSGPNYETCAEIKMMRTFGGDAVCMSTVPEVIAGVQMGLRILGISCITNMAAGLSSGKLLHQEVQETAEKMKEKFVNLLKNVIIKIYNNSKR
jgi:purine-nucleoside phosphorylase